MLVCKSWFTAFQEPSLHSVFNLEPYFDSPSESPRWWTLQFESKIDSMLLSTVQSPHQFLTQIRIRHCSDRSLNLVAQRCPNLEVSSIRPLPRSANLLHRATNSPLRRFLAFPAADHHSNIAAIQRIPSLLLTDFECVVVTGLGFGRLKIRR
ncbi:hypothetical protein RYX36_018865 [Vicia faba]